MVELDQDDFDLLMQCAVTHALLVSDGTVDAMQRLVREHGIDLSVRGRRIIGALLVEGPLHERDDASWRDTLLALQPGRRS